MVNVLPRDRRDALRTPEVRTPCLLYINVPWKVVPPEAPVLAVTCQVPLALSYVTRNVLSFQKRASATLKARNLPDVKTPLESYTRLPSRSSGPLAVPMRPLMVHVPLV